MPDNESGTTCAGQYCAGQHGSRENRCDPDFLRQELIARADRKSECMRSPTAVGGQTHLHLAQAHDMASRVRHCVECPKCFTRYLPGFSPYRNGSYLLPMVEGFADEWTLYCACGRPPISSRWSWSDLKLYAVSNQAHDRGYGPPEEIVSVDKKSHLSG